MNKELDAKTIRVYRDNQDICTRPNKDSAHEGRVLFYAYPKMPQVGNYENAILVT